MAGPALVYDASRLCARALNATPNGIDRLDALLSRGLLADRDTSAPALVFGLGGPRLVPAAEALAALDRAERAWREEEDGTGCAPGPLVSWLVGRGPAAAPPGAGARERCIARVGRLGPALATLASLGLRRGADPVRTAPQRAVVLNASHFPLDWPSHVAWLDRRRDVRLAVLVHDLLPLDHPEWFWPGEVRRHRARLALLAARGAGAIVTSAVVEDRLRREMARAGRHDLAVLRAAPPVAAPFRRARPPDLRLAGARYFVVCGTVEPRKNHRVLLRVWRRLAAERGAAAPRLVVVGKRGWGCEDILREMRALAAAGHLVQACGLASPACRALLDGSLALLAPSWAEGYGLPVAEALACGVPVVASDIPAFREQGVARLIDPADDGRWHDAVAALADAGPAAPRPPPRVPAADAASYLGAVRGFLDALG